MLVSIAVTFFCLQVVVGDEYNYEYYAGYDDDFYGDDAEDSSTFSPRPSVGRVRRFHIENSIQSGDPREIEVIKGAFKRIFSGRKMPDSFITEVTTLENMPLHESLRYKLIPTLYSYDEDNTVLPNDLRNIAMIPTRVRIAENVDRTSEAAATRVIRPIRPTNVATIMPNIVPIISKYPTHSPNVMRRFQLRTKSLIHGNNINTIPRSTTRSPTYTQMVDPLSEWPQEPVSDLEKFKGLYSPKRSSFFLERSDVTPESLENTEVEHLFPEWTLNLSTFNGFVTEDLKSSSVVDTDSSEGTSLKMHPVIMFSERTEFTHLFPEWTLEYGTNLVKFNGFATEDVNERSSIIDTDSSDGGGPDVQTNAIQNMRKNIEDDNGDLNNDLDDNHKAFLRTITTTDFTGSTQTRGARKMTTSTFTTPTTQTTTPTPTTSTTTVTTTTTVPTTTTPTTTKVRFDVEKFLEILANLTYDYETNLTMQVNMTLHKMKVPTCGLPTTVPPTTTTTISTTIADYSGFNRTIMAKCFVCGLESPGVPYEANCADAFAGDFLPLVPQDPRARANIARYKKYCRYAEVRNYFLNESQPRTIYGRWTGGCSVRWSDVTGIYTQRSCRNRRRATTGLHYASKRMAKLEMALTHKDNACIISPVATLLPLSRGISLFARFHACVCTGDWCNMTEETKPSTFSAICAILAVLLASRQLF